MIEAAALLGEQGIHLSPEWILCLQGAVPEELRQPAAIQHQFQSSPQPERPWKLPEIAFIGRHNLTARQYPVAFDELVIRGSGPVVVSGYGDGFYPNHMRVAKCRMLAVLNAKREKQRKAAYGDLLNISRQVVRDTQKATSAINARPTFDPLAMALGFQIEHYAGLTGKVIDQAERRVLRGESVPAKDKVVSLFEPHTDIIIKDRRDTLFGHKICLTGGVSNLILDCLITEGNPADSDLTIPMLDRQKQIYGRYPLKASLDGGFASKTNLTLAKERKIKDVCFAKKRGLSETDMCRSQYVYRRLRRFRAGIESGISWLKRCLGLTRCTWKGWDAFKSYVWSSIVAANLLTLARAKAEP